MFNEYIAKYINSFNDLNSKVIDIIKNNPDKKPFKPKK